MNSRGFLLLILVLSALVCGYDVYAAVRSQGQNVVAWVLAALMRVWHARETRMVPGGCVASNRYEAYALSVLSSMCDMYYMLVLSHLSDVSAMIEMLVMTEVSVMAEMLEL